MTDPSTDDEAYAYRGWRVWVSDDRNDNGDPITLTVAPGDELPVSDADALWLRQRLRDADVGQPVADIPAPYEPGEGQA